MKSLKTVCFIGLCLFVFGCNEPTFVPGEGFYTDPVSVQIVNNLQGGKVYYTTDGSAPSAASTEYTAAIDVDENTVIKAVSILANQKSDVASGVFAIEEDPDPEPCITCEGTLSGTRWCDQGDGTVKDMTTGLVWLKDASWGGRYPLWRYTIDSFTSAHDRAAQLLHGTAGLIDGSVEGEWRLPTKEELYRLANGTEAVTSENMRAFTGGQSYWYWSSTGYAPDNFVAWSIDLIDGSAVSLDKNNDLYVWPVRCDN